MFLVPVRRAARHSTGDLSGAKTYVLRLAALRMVHLHGYSWFTCELVENPIW